jgi:hypothetical protein
MTYHNHSQYSITPHKGKKEEGQEKGRKKGEKEKGIQASRFHKIFLRFSVFTQGRSRFEKEPATAAAQHPSFLPLLLAPLALLLAHHVPQSTEGRF